ERSVTMPTLPITAAAEKLAVAEKHIPTATCLTLSRRAWNRSGHDRRLERRRNLHAVLAGALDRPLHQAGRLGDFQELTDISEPPSLTFRHRHRLQVLAIATIEHTRAGKLGGIFEQRRPW